MNNNKKDVRNNHPNYSEGSLLHHKISGFTLIELLISMVLSLFLIGGVVSIYISSKHTAHARKELSSIEDNARAAIRTLTQHIGHAGYATPQHLDLDEYIIATGTTINAGLCSDGTGNITNSSLLKDSQDGATSDTITISVLADSSLNSDCSGQTLKPACLVGSAANIQGTKIYNSFYIQTPAGETAPSLFCAGSVSATPIRLADGIDDMQFKYGIDTTADLVADRYLTATQINATPNLWSNIVSVQLALLVSSISNVKTIAESHTFQLLDKTITKTDRKQHAVFTTEINLRNVSL